MFDMTPTSHEKKEKETDSHFPVWVVSLNGLISNLVICLCLCLCFSSSSLLCKCTTMQFSMPGSWIRRTVANILSGNYCQPRCDEPWTEVLFTDPQEGSLQVIVAPLNKLSRQSLAEGESIDKVGTMEGIINALGPNITGNTIEEEEVVSSEAKTIDGVTYYWYTLDTPYAKTGQHQVATIAAKDNAVFVLAVSASDKQWSQNKGNIRTIAESFRI